MSLSAELVVRYRSQLERVVRAEPISLVNITGIRSTNNKMCACGKLQQGLADDCAGFIALKTMRHRQ